MLFDIMKLCIYVLHLIDYLPGMVAGMKNILLFCLTFLAVKSFNVGRLLKTPLSVCNWDDPMLGLDFLVHTNHLKKMNKVCFAKNRNVGTATFHQSAPWSTVKEKPLLNTRSPKLQPILFVLHEKQQWR